MPLTTVSRKVVEARLMAWVNTPARYKLGAGGTMPLSWTPTDSSGFLDCSKLVLAALGLPRLIDGVWLDTTAIHYDAIHEHRWFVAVQSYQVLVGDVRVYPDLGPRQGHAGVVLSGPGADAVRIVDASPANEKRNPGRCIQITGHELWMARPDAIWCRYLGILP